MRRNRRFVRVLAELSEPRRAPAPPRARAPAPFLAHAVVQAAMSRPGPCIPRCDRIRLAPPRAGTRCIRRSSSSST